MKVNCIFIHNLFLHFCISLPISKFNLPVHYKMNVLLHFDHRRRFLGLLTISPAPTDTSKGKIHRQSITKFFSPNNSNLMIINNTIIRPAVKHATGSFWRAARPALKQHPPKRQALIKIGTAFKHNVIGSHSCDTVHAKIIQLTIVPTAANPTANKQFFVVETQFISFMVFSPFIAVYVQANKNRLPTVLSTIDSLNIQN